MQLLCLRTSRQHLHSYTHLHTNISTTPFSNKYVYLFYFVVSFYLYIKKTWTYWTVKVSLFSSSRYFCWFVQWFVNLFLTYKHVSSYFLFAPYLNPKYTPKIHLPTLCLKRTMRRTKVSHGSNRVSGGTRGRDRESDDKNWTRREETTDTLLILSPQMGGSRRVECSCFLLCSDEKTITKCNCFLLCNDKRFPKRLVRESFEVFKRRGSFEVGEPNPWGSVLGKRSGEAFWEVDVFFFIGVSLAS